MNLLVSGYYAGQRERLAIIEVWRRIEIGSPIDRDPAIRAGRPKIAGTGVTVMRVAGWYKMSLAPEEIATQYGHLSLAQVHAALAYYHANPEEIEGDLAQEETFAEGVESGPLLSR